MDQRILKIILNKLEGDLSKGQLQELDDWLGQSDEHHILFEEQKTIWEESMNVAIYEQFDTANAYRKLTRNFDEFKQKSINRKPWISVAIPIAACLILFFAYEYFTALFQAPEEIIVETELNEKATVLLPDGSSVRLNSRSELTFSINADRKKRCVALSGEAYFDVAERKIPFIVNVQDRILVKVLGTQFVIRAYPEDEVLNVVLEQGQVMVSQYSREDNSILMQPGQMAQFNSSMNSFEVSEVDTELYSGRITNRLQFHDNTLEELIEKIEVKYDVVFELPIDSFNQNHSFSGTIQDEAIDNVLKALSAIVGIEFIRNGSIITIVEDQ